MMKRTILIITFIIYLLLAAACESESVAGGASNSASPSVEEQEAVTSGSGFYFSINEVGVGEDGFVALTNFTDIPASLAGLYLCQGADCFGLPDVVVDPGSTVRIAVGDGNGIEDVVAIEATLGKLRPADGELALYNSNDYHNPQAMAIYFQWGSNPHKLTKTALDAGLWVEGGYGPTSQNATRLFKVEETGLWLFEE